jgi:hypothetical protein
MSDPATGQPESVADANGPSLGRGAGALGTKAEHLIAYQHPRGSNGGVHRGPDRFPRVTQAIFLRALAEAKVRKVKGNGGGKKIKVTVEMAMAGDLVTMMQRIAERAAKGRNLNEGLRLLEIMEKTFRNRNERTSGGHPEGERSPIPAVFIRCPEGRAVASQAAAEPAREGIEVDGQQYVE